MEKQLEKHHHEELSAAHALQNMADGLPARSASWRPCSGS